MTIADCFDTLVASVSRAKEFQGFSTWSTYSSITIKVCPESFKSCYKFCSMCTQLMGNRRAAATTVTPTAASDTALEIIGTRTLSRQGSSGARRGPPTVTSTTTRWFGTALDICWVIGAESRGRGTAAIFTIRCSKADTWDTINRALSVDCGECSRRGCKNSE